MYSTIGKRVPRIEGEAKVTGQSSYVDDISLPMMLCGRILRSPHPHARILDIDTSRAEKLKGVKAVITSKDTKGRKYGVYARYADQLVLAREKVRYIGDEVAAVAAVDQDVAEEALDLIKVEYQLLPAVFDAEEAMGPEAPLIHEVERNICVKTAMDFGDADRGFRESDYIREDTFETGRQAHCQMEPHAVVASFDASGRLSVWTPNMSPFVKRRVLSNILDIPEHNVRICKTYVGGAFGGKSEVFPLDACAALLSMKTGRPVKIAYTRDEVFMTTRHRHNMVIHLKTGVKRDGTIIAREARVIADKGAYASTGPIAIWLACSQLFRTYRAPNVRYQGFNVYTNKTPCGAMRGHGSIQMRFADDSQMDMIAEDLGIDAVELRLRNARQPGDIMPLKNVVTSCGLSECIRRAAHHSGWENKRKKMGANRGIGIGCTTGMTSFNTGHSFPSSAIVKFTEDGAATLLTGAVEDGQGTETMLAQIVAEELGLPVKDITVMSGDTENVASDVGAFTMAQTFVTGRAVKLAAADAKRQLFELAAPALQAGIEQLEVRDCRVCVAANPLKSLTFPQLIRAGFNQGITVVGKGHFHPDTEFNVATGEGKSSPTYSFCAQVAEVEVNVQTGEVKVIGQTMAHDCGYAINPMDVEAQLEGAIAVSQGFALSEEIQWADGQMLNPSFLAYRLPQSVDLPRIDTEIVETVDPDGPFGAKDVGEPAVHTGAPAIANAIYDAIGVRIKSLPITPAKILRALQRKAK